MGTFCESKALQLWVQKQSSFLHFLRCGLCGFEHPHSECVGDAMFTSLTLKTFKIQKLTEQSWAFSLPGLAFILMILMGELNVNLDSLDRFSPNNNCLEHCETKMTLQMTDLAAHSCALMAVNSIFFFALQTHDVPTHPLRRQAEI